MFSHSCVMSLGSKGQSIEKVVDDFRIILYRSHGFKSFEAFISSIKQKHFSSINDVVIRTLIEDKTSAEGGQFGPTRVSYMWKNKILWIDYYMSPEEWRNLPYATVKANFAKSIRLCFERVLERLRRKQELINEAGYVAEFEKLMKRFINLPDSTAA